MHLQMVGGLVLTHFGPASQRMNILAANQLWKWIHQD